MEFLQEKGHGTTATLNLSLDDGAYFIQPVKVEPHSHYRLSLMARMNQGVITVVVKGGKDENKVEHRLLGQVQTRLTMFPSFWNEKSSKFLVFEANQWRPVTLDFDSGELTKVDVLIGGYYKKGSYSFDDVSVVKVDK